MRAGKLRNRVQIQEFVGTVDEFGEIADPSDTANWQTLATRWASVEPMSGRELMVAQQIHGDISHKVTLRYYGGLTEQNRLMFGDRILNIAAPPINTEERNKKTICICKEKTSGG